MKQLNEEQKKTIQANWNAGHIRIIRDMYASPLWRLRWVLAKYWAYGVVTNQGWMPFSIVAFCKAKMGHGKGLASLFVEGELNMVRRVIQRRQKAA